MQADHATVRALLDHCPLGTVVLDGDGRIAHINHILRDFLGPTGAELAGKSGDELPDELKYLTSPAETEQLSVDGETHWLRCWSSPLGDDAAQTVNYYLDVTGSVRLQQAHDHLSAQVDSLVTTHPVSGLMNRRSLFQVLDSQVSRSRRYHNLLSVVLMSASATYPVDSISPARIGDDGIRLISNLLKDQMRWSDQIAQLDDERFFLLLPETDAAAAVAITEKLRYRISSATITDAEGNRLDVDLRFGIAEWSKGDDSRRLFQRVQERLNGAEAVVD